MEKVILKQVFPNFDDYLGVELPGLTELESVYICLHSSGDSRLIQRKMWQGENLSEGEHLFVNGLKKTLNKLESVKGQNITRYEINLNDTGLEELKKELNYCKEKGVPFSNRAFWNFSVHDWKHENFRIEVRTPEKSGAKMIYTLMGETGLSEREVTYSPGCLFKIVEIDDRKGLLEELEYA